MNFDLASNLSSTLVIVGLTLIFVFLYFKKRTSFAHSLILELYQLNKDVNQDVLTFIAQSWVILEKAGFQKMVGKIEWYGELKKISFGKEQSFLKQKLFFKNQRQFLVKVDEGDIKIDLTLETKQKIRGENKLIAEIIYQTFLLLLSSNTTSKNMQFVLSKERLERFQLFIHHDIKNIAQFISLLNNQIKSVKTTEEKTFLIDKLQKILPSVSEKSKKVTMHMATQNAFEDVKKIDLISQLKYYAEASDVSVQIESDLSKVCINISEMALRQVLTEMIENFKYHTAGNQPLKIVVLLQEFSVLLKFQSPKQTELISPERIFEPFWTTNESGMGLGLFITREILKKIGGSVECHDEGQVIDFIVKLPC